MRPVAITQSIIVHAPRPRVFDLAISITPSEFIKPTLVLPGIQSTEGPSRWTASGDLRRHVLTDGAAIEEELTAFAKDEYYAYRISGFEDPFARLVSGAYAKWRFDWQGPEQTEIEWRYAFEPQGRVSRPFLAAVAGLLWPGYLRAALKRLKERAENAS